MKLFFENRDQCRNDPTDDLDGEFGQRSAPGWQEDDPGRQQLEHSGQLPESSECVDPVSVVE